MRDKSVQFVIEMPCLASKFERSVRHELFERNLWDKVLCTSNLSCGLTTSMWFSRSIAEKVASYGVCRA